MPLSAAAVEAGADIYGDEKLPESWEQYHALRCGENLDKNQQNLF
jgi:hypothetical protein